MGRRSAIVLFTIALLPMSVAADQETGLRVTSSMGGTLRRGESAAVTWTVTGTMKPVRLLLENRSPGVGTLEGGDVQIVTTSGGSPNTVSRNVTGISPGALTVKVEIEPGSGASTEVIVAAFQRELQRIAAVLDNAAKELPVERSGMLQRKTVQLEAVLELLDRVEADVRKSLPYRELMPFQDAVARRIEMDQRALIRSAVAEIVPDRSTIALVQERSEARVNEKVAKETLASRADWFHRLGDTSPLARVCFRRTPTKNSMIAVFPASVPADRDSTPFVSPLTLYLGEYLYEVTRDGGVTNTGQMDILLNPERVLDCPDVDGPGCRLIAGPTENCQ